MKRIVSMLLAVLISSATVFASEVLPHEYSTVTWYTDYLANYHLTAKETVDDGLKGGEGFQCMYAYERHDKYPEYVARAYDTCGVYYSTDGAKTWKFEEWMEDGLNRRQGLSMGVNDLEYHPDDPQILYSYRWGVDNEKIVGGLYVSEDAGKTSRRIYTFARSKNRYNFDGWIKFGAYDESKKTYPLYMVQANGSSRADAGLYVSYDWQSGTNDDGSTIINYKPTFERIAYGDVKTDGLIRRFTMSHQVVQETGKKLMIASSCYARNAADNGWDNKYGDLKASYDGGRTWEYVIGENSELGNFMIGSIAIDPMDYMHWIVSPFGTWDDDNKGCVMLYETKNGGKSWNKINVENWNVVPPKAYVDENEDGIYDNEMLKDGLILGKAGSTIVAQIEITFPNKKDGKQAIVLCVDECNWPYRISYDGGKTFQYINDDFRHFLGKDETGWYCDPIALSEGEPDEILVGIWKGEYTDYKNWYPQNKREEYGITSDTIPMFDFKWNDSLVSGKLATSFLWGKDGQIKRIGGFDVGTFEVLPGYDGEFPPVADMRRNTAFANATAADICVDPSDDNHMWGIAGTTSYSQETILVETFDNFKTSRYYVNMQMRRRERAKADNVSDYTQMKVEYAPGSKNVLFSGLFYSEDNGKTWRESQYIIKGVSGFNPKVCYAMGDKVNGTSNQIMISYDGAKTWQSTGITIPNIEDTFMVDRTEDYVVWLGEHNTYNVLLHRVDLKTGKIKTIGKAQGLDGGREGEATGLQLKNMMVSDYNPGVMCISGTDFYGRHGYCFISYDAGESWHQIPGMPCFSSGHADFHPSKSQLWIGGAMGIWVFNYGEYAKVNGITLKTIN